MNNFIFSYFKLETRCISITSMTKRAFSFLSRFVIERTMCRCPWPFYFLHIGIFVLANESPSMLFFFSLSRPLFIASRRQTTYIEIFRCFFFSLSSLFFISNLLTSSSRHVYIYLYRVAMTKLQSRHC
jgi:hypothetical protein